MYKLLLPILLLAVACNPNTTKQQQQAKQEQSRTVATKPSAKIELSLVEKESKLRLNETIEIAYTSNISAVPDSVEVITESNKKWTAVKPNSPLHWVANHAKTGSNSLRVKFYYGDSISQQKLFSIKLYPDTKPKTYTYRVKNTWPHNTRAYTQGLEFSDGILYEGTGQYGESSLSKIELDKGEVLQSMNLSKDVFGEGITIFNDKVYQLTWRSSTGFVYEKNSLKKLYDFSYPTEGWGLCNDGNELIMSDGSEKIYYLDTEFLQETKRLHVYDYLGPVMNLNELEYINGLIYANVYGTNLIVAFDANTGAVVKKIDLSGLLDRKKYNKPVDVLNGIAWDKQKERLVVTGKWWPYFYEIEPVEE